jgi:hypothetical protein
MFIQIADPDLFQSQIQDLGSQISDPTTKTSTERRGKISCLIFFVAINLNFTKLKIIFFELVQKNLNQLKKYMGLGSESGRTYPESRGQIKKASHPKTTTLLVITRKI